MILTPKLLVAITASESATLFSRARRELRGDIPGAEMKNLSLGSDSQETSLTLLEHRPLALGCVTPTSCKIVVGYESRIVVCEAVPFCPFCPEGSELTTEDILNDVRLETLSTFILTFYSDFKPDLNLHPSSPPRILSKSQE